MIEEALVATLKAALPDVRAFPLFPPEKSQPPFIVYREVDSASTDGFYAETETRVFELDACAGVGLNPSDYRASKLLAEQVRDALAGGFEHEGTCVYRVEVAKRRDLINAEEKLHWTRAAFSFTHDLLI